MYEPSRMWLCVIMIWLVVTTFVSAQDPSEDFEKWNDVGPLPCDQVRSLVDVFLGELVQSRDTVGWIVIHGNRRVPYSAFSQKKLIERQIASRKADQEKVKVVYGDSEESLRLEFLKGSRQHRFIESTPEKALGLDLRDSSRLLFYSSSWTSEVCDDVFELSEFLRIASYRPRTNAEIVLKGPREFLSTEESKIRTQIRALNPPGIRLVKKISSKKEIQHWIVFHHQ